MKSKGNWTYFELAGSSSYPSCSYWGSTFFRARITNLSCPMAQDMSSRSDYLNKRGPHLRADVHRLISFNFRYLLTLTCIILLLLVIYNLMFEIQR